MIVTAVLAVAAAGTAWIGYTWSQPFVLAFAVGCLVGLIHEVFQSGGKILSFARNEDGLYLGALAEMLLGAVSGLLSARGVSTVDAASLRSLAYDAFLAGVALKGIAEAAGGSAVSSMAKPSVPKGFAALAAPPANVQPPSF